MFRLYLLLLLLFLYELCFSQEKNNLKINLNNSDIVSLYSGVGIFSDSISIYNDTVMYVDISKNNLFYLKKDQKKYYLFITSESMLECSFLQNDEFSISGDYANFSYFITEFYQLYKMRIHELFLLNTSSDEFEIKLYTLLNDEIFQFYQNHKSSSTFNLRSQDYFNDLLKYEYLNNLSIYLMNQTKDSLQGVPFYRDLNINLLNWNDLTNNMHDVNFHELDIFQNYIFNSLILFASYNYKYHNSDKFQLFNNYLFSFAFEHLPQEMLFFFFKNYINNFSNSLNKKTKTYFKNLLNKTELSKLEIRNLLDSDNFKNQEDIHVDNSKIIESDFYLEDINGDKVSLTDFQGKLLYVDIWASWCGPCRKQFPYAKQLKDKFSKRQLKKIKFIYISIDTDYGKWKESLEKLNLDGYQFISPPDKPQSASSYFGVSSIPRYLIIDKNGNILSENAKRPSDLTLFDDLLDLIK